MKKRSMILALASMLGISAAATAVSGFAWFTTQRTATISSMSYKVGAAEGSLELADAQKSYNIATIDATNPSAVGVTPDSTRILADVSSGEGETFYKAALKANAPELDHYVEENDGKETAGEKKKWVSEINENQNVCVSWDLKVKNTAAGSKLDVCLSNNGDIFTPSATGNAVTTAYVAPADNTTAVTLPAPAANKAAITSVKIGGGDVSWDATPNAAGKIEAITLATPVAKDTTIDVVYAADYTEYFRLAIIDVTDDENHELVFMHANAQHLGYVTSESDTAIRGSGTLAKYVSTVSTINSTADDAYGTGDVDVDNQVLVEDLVKDDDHTLRFVVWCEGTATPELPVTANSVDLAFNLVGLTPAA